MTTKKKPVKNVHEVCGNRRVLLREARDYWHNKFYETQVRHQEDLKLLYHHKKQAAALAVFLTTIVVSIIYSVAFMWIV